MGAEPFTKLPMNLRQESGPSTNLARLQYATERARVLFGCYRRGDANDPDQYVTSIAAVLTLYDEAIIRQVTDPRTGISTDGRFSTFMPNSGELKIYCDAIQARKYESSLSYRPFVRSGPINPPKPPPGHFSYGEFLDMAARGEVKTRPIGRFETK